MIRKTHTLCRLGHMRLFVLYGITVAGRLP